MTYDVDVHLQENWVGVSLLLMFAVAVAVSAILIWRATRRRP
jgi:hypothetical protein